MEVCNQITILILYSVSSRPVTVLKVTDSILTLSDLFVLTVSFKFINFKLKKPSFLTDSLSLIFARTHVCSVN